MYKVNYTSGFRSRHPPAMNNYKLLLEASLFEFDWGQEKPINLIPNPDQFAMSPEQIQAGTLMDFESCIAKYHNWVHATRLKEANDKVALLTKPDILVFRANILTAIEQRFIREDGYHPVMLLYAAECRRYTEQDCICLSPTRQTKTQPIHSVYIGVKPG